MRILTKVLVPFVVIGSATLATAQTYDCSMYSQGSGGWVGSRMIFSLVPADGTGFVFDAVINSAYETPIPAKLTKRKDTLWRYKWKVDGAPSSNAGKLNLSYSALLNTQNGKVTLNGILHGSDNVISGEGRRVKVKG